MSSMLSTIDTQIKFLRKACGSFGKRTLKDRLTESENMLADLKNKKKKGPPDFLRLLEPFFHAVEIDENKYYMTAISCYTAIFKSKPERGYIDVIIMNEILKSLFKIDKFPIEENRVKAASCLIACISSVSAKMFVHGSVLYFIFEYLLRIYNNATLPETRDGVGKIINQLVDYYLGNYGKPVFIPHFQTIEELASTSSDIICNNSLIITKYCPKTNATINDVDIIMIIRAFCSVIGRKETTIATSLLSTKVIQQIITLQTPFVKSSFFLKELRTTIHVALLSLCLDANDVLAKPTADIIITLWKRFSQFYNEGLNEVLDQGIATALVSPSQNMMIRSFHLYTYLIQDPQFMVDSFVNYDCDDSGIFHNIFENTVNIIVKRSYPEQVSVGLQKEAMKTLLTILKNLWKYYTDLSSNTKDEKTETVAESVISQKKAKNQIERCQEVFKKSPNKALKYFSTHNLCKDTPQSYADFLFNTGWLDPTGVGEIIGGSKPLNLEILPLFVNHFDFKGQSFEQAFRTFLSKFRIPGESQMIDRIMQEFGTKYYNDNSSLFSCADTVYVLAYSTLMLHTDAHHPTITNHMTLDEFIKNNRGIDNGKDLPKPFLIDLYNGITSKKINLTQNNLSSIPINNIALMSQRQQAELFKERSKHTLEVARQRTTTEMHQHRFHQAKSPLLIGPMFQCVWGGIVAALSMSFEMSDDEDIDKLCLSGFQYSTHIASHCYIEDALETLVDSFAKFTRIRTYSTQLKPKNFLCTQALFKCALDDREYLKGAWSIILGECSALDKMSSNKSFQTDFESILPLFQKSGSLDRESIIDFVSALCEVTSAEMSEKPPRLTMFRNLESVALLNMEVRTMIVWREIWQIIANFVIKFGQSENVDLSKSVLSVLQLLSAPFLQKEETTRMHHKSMFLLPFYDVFDHQSSMEIKKFILDIIENLIEKFGDKLQSGWEPILQILIDTAQQPKLISRGLDILQFIIIHNFLNVKAYQPEILLTAVVTYIMKDTTGKISLQVVALFPIIADNLTRDDEQIWLLLLSSLQRCLKNSNEEVCSSIENSLVSIIIKHGFKRTEIVESLPMNEQPKSPSKNYNEPMNLTESSEIFTESSELFNSIEHFDEKKGDNENNENNENENSNENNNENNNESNNDNNNENNNESNNDNNNESNNENNNESNNDNNNESNNDNNNESNNENNNESNDNENNNDNKNESNDNEKSNENTNDNTENNNENTDSTNNNANENNNENNANENSTDKKDENGEATKQEEVEHNEHNQNETVNENGLVRRVVEIEPAFTKKVWIEFLTNFLSSVFSFSETNRIRHLVELLKYINASIFDKYSPSLACYSQEILNFLIHCGTGTKNVEMRHASLKCIESFVSNNAKEFESEQLSAALIELFESLLPELIDSVISVEVLAGIIDVFSGDYKTNKEADQTAENEGENEGESNNEDKYANLELANKFIEILGKLSECCSKERTKQGILPTWCAARDQYFRCIVRQNREDEVVENLNESLEFYESLRQGGNEFKGWDQLIAHKLKATANMEIGLFKKCAKRSTDLFCNLVEVDDDEVRKELVPLLKKQLQVADE